MEDLSSFNKYKPIRGQYKKFSVEEKKEAIEEVNLGKEVHDVARERNIPLKNLKRWIVVGAKRKEGGGRKTMDPQMEE